MKIITVFDFKYYQPDIGKFSQTLLLGEICHISKQSQTELFGLIRNNVVGVIQHEEVDYLIK